MKGQIKDAVVGEKGKALKNKVDILKVSVKNVWKN